MTKETKARKEQMYEMRLAGMTYEEIAAEVGLTRQRVHQLIGRTGKRKPYIKHRVITEHDCVYAGLRNWINEYGVTITDFVRMMYDGEYTPEKAEVFNRAMRGGDCRKSIIDRVISVTGLTYEQAFGGVGSE